MKTTLLSLALFSLLACGKDTSGDSGAFELQDFSGGLFQISTLAVEDGCMDGAFDLIFMPEGAETPSDWTTSTEFPAYDALPSTYEISLQEPFSSMEVTLSEGDNGLTVGDANQSGVELDADAWPGCMVDMGITAELMVHTDDHLMGSAVLTTSSFDEESCPAVSSEPCQIILDLSAQRVE